MKIQRGKKYKHTAMVIDKSNNEPIGNFGFWHIPLPFTDQHRRLNNGTLVDLTNRIQQCALEHDLEISNVKMPEFEKFDILLSDVKNFESKDGGIEVDGFRVYIHMIEVI